MANKLSPDKERLSYAEKKEVAAELRNLAKKRGVELTVVLKEAAAEYLESRKKK